MGKVGDQSHKQGTGLQGQAQGLLWTDAFKDIDSEEKCMSYCNLCKLRNNESIETYLGLSREFVKFWHTEVSGENPDTSFLWLHSL